MEIDKNWHTLAEASRMLGKGNSYVSLWLRRHDGIPKDMLRDYGSAKFINDNGIQWIVEHTKKEGVLKSSKVAIEDKFLKFTVLGNTLNGMLKLLPNHNDYTSWPRVGSWHRLRPRV